MGACSFGEVDGPVSSASTERGAWAQMTEETADVWSDAVPGRAYQCSQWFKGYFPDCHL